MCVCLSFLVKETKINLKSHVFRKVVCLFSIENVSEKKKTLIEMMRRKKEAENRIENWVKPNKNECNGKQNKPKMWCDLWRRVVTDKQIELYRLNGGGERETELFFKVETAQNTRLLTFFISFH